MFFQTKIEKLTNAGIENIIIDPGFGFGKTLHQKDHKELVNEFVNTDTLSSLNLVPPL